MFNGKKQNKNIGTRRLDDVESLVSADGDVFHVRIELLDLGSEERPNSAEDADVALQFQNGVVQLATVRLVTSLLLLKDENRFPDLLSYKFYNISLDIRYYFSYYIK